MKKSVYIVLKLSEVFIHHSYRGRKTTEQPDQKTIA